MSEASSTATSTDRKKLIKRVGVVVSDKGDKTIKVQYSFSVKHPKYGKYLRRRTNILAHDEKNEAKAGDRVEVAACRRMSKRKSWRLTRVLESL